jgi:hypothetical protein
MLIYLAILFMSLKKKDKSKGFRILQEDRSERWSSNGFGYFIGFVCALRR